jgi:hypothetical protein
VKSVLEEFVPSAADAIEVAKGRVVLVDGTLRIRRQGLPGHWPGNPEEETERRRANLVRQGIQLPDLVVSRAGRAPRRPFQELEDSPH